VVDGWMSMEQWWNDIDRGNLKYWEKNHYTAWVVDGWMSIEQWWNDTDRENWSARRKILYSVGGKWMSMEQWWNDTDSGKLKDLEKNIIQRGWEVNEWVWSNGGMILTGDNWKTGRKTLYCVGGRWMNMEQWWNDTDRGKLKDWEKNII